MSKIPLAALLFFALPGLAWAQSRHAPARPRITDHDLMFRCPLEVSAACPQRCADHVAAAACRWPAFGCDFKVCWADPRQQLSREDILDAVADPASYALPPGIPAPAGGANAFSTVRITAQGGGELYLIGGRFVQDIYGLDSPQHARAYIQRAQACAILASRVQAAFIARSAGSPAVYYVSCGSSNVGFREVQAAPAAPAATAGNSPPASGAAVAPTPGTIDYDRINRMSDQELQTMLQNTGLVSINGNRITVSGVNPFSANTDPDDREEALADLHPDERVALKGLYVRNVNRALENAQQSRPAPDGQAYVFNDDTGQAELRTAPAPGSKQ